MSRKRYKPEQIISMLREADVQLSRGQKVAQICRELGIAEQTYYRWRREYGGLKVSQAKRLKELERENTRLKRAVAGASRSRKGTGRVAKNWRRLVVIFLPFR